MEEVSLLLNRHQQTSRGLTLNFLVKELSIVMVDSDVATSKTQNNFCWGLLITPSCPLLTCIVCGRLQLLSPLFNTCILIKTHLLRVFVTSSWQQKQWPICHSHKFGSCIHAVIIFKTKRYGNEIWKWSHEEWA